MIRIIKKKNPTDQKIINKLKISKEKDNETGEIFYQATIDNEFVADVIINEKVDYIVDIYIDKKYHRKGIGTFLYDYVEKDLNIKLQPSGGPELKGHSNLGKAFWQNRLKTRANPIDKLFLSQIKIQKEKIKYYIRYKAYLDNNVVATADFFPEDNSVSSVYVNSPYRRKGLASFMYDTIEKDQKVSLIPSQDLLPDGRRFWENRIKDKPEKLGLLYR